MSTLFHNIPKELKLIPSWVCFDVVEGNKTPFIPGTDSNASPNRPTEWRSYAAAKADVMSGRRTHVAFCFSSTDPYVFIDLDDPSDEDQQSVMSRLKTYAQISASGQGLHLICKGTFSGPGRHPSKPKAGIFKEGRFCVMTGNVLEGREKIRSIDEDIIQAVHSWLSVNGTSTKHRIELQEYEQEIPDQTVFEMGCDGYRNYRELAAGNWQQFPEYNNDHSTADHAFIGILADLTECNSQVIRLFQMSGMWNDERALKKAGHGLEGYVERSLKTIRANQYHKAVLRSRHPILFDEDPVEIIDEDEEEGSGVESVTELVAPEPEVIPPVGKRDLIDAIPSGLIRDIAEYSFSTSFYPLQEASVCSGIIGHAGICGRGYLTPTKAGLNLWLILVGGTSSGKNEYQSCLKRIFSLIAKEDKSSRKIFGGEIVSGPGLETTFAETARYISYIPEFGDTFKLLANPAAPDYVKSLTRGLLNSYNSADKSGSSEGRRKAQSEEVTFIERPSLCLAGEATPESLYGAMSLRELNTGFLQRFIILDAPTSSWSLQENAGHAKSPPPELIARIKRLMHKMNIADQQGKYRVVGIGNKAASLLKEHRDEKRKLIMTSTEGLGVKEIINRAGLKSIRLAANAAVSRDPDCPKILLQDAEWAINFVDATDANLIARFRKGEVGSGQVKQEAELISIIETLMTLPYSVLRESGHSKAAVRARAVLYSEIKRRAVTLPSFAADRLGAVTAFEKCLRSVVDESGRYRSIESVDSHTLKMGGRRLIAKW